MMALFPNRKHITGATRTYVVFVAGAAGFLCLLSAFVYVSGDTSSTGRDRLASNDEAKSGPVAGERVATVVPVISGLEGTSPEVVPNQFTLDFLPRAVAPGEHGASVSEAELSAKNRLAEQEAEKEALLRQVEREALEESIVLLLTEGTSQVFIMTGYSLDSGSPQFAVQRAALHDPRAAKILTAATTQDEQTRRHILDTTLTELASYLDSSESTNQENSRYNLDMFARAALLLVLSEVDDTGISIPYLVSWYERDLMAAERSEEYLAREGLIEQSTTGNQISTVTMNFIASSVNRILERVDEGSGAATGFPFRPYSRVDDHAIPLEGYPLLPALDYPEW